MKHVAAARSCAGESLRACQVANDDLDTQRVELRGVAGGPCEASDPVAIPHQPLRQVTPDEAARAGYQANIVARSDYGLLAKRSLLDHREPARTRRLSVAVAMSRTTDQFLLAPA